MKNKFTFIIILLCAAFATYGQSIFLNEITDTNPPADNPYTNGQVFDSNLTVSGIGRGTNISPAPAAHTVNRYAANNWSVTFHPDDYFEFVLSPNPGYQIDFINFIYDGKRISFFDTPPNNIVIRSSLDGFVSDIGNPTLDGTNTIDLSDGIYQNITTTITFRVYAWGGASAGIFGLDRFEFNGTVEPIPCYSATTSTWDGGSWDNGIPANTNTIAIIDGNYNTSTGGDQDSFTACSLTVNNGYTLTIADGDFIEIDNDITVGGTIIVNPQGAVVQNNNDAIVTNNGSITVEKETALMNDWYEYTYWSSPVANETVGNALTDADDNMIFTFNGANYLDATMEINNDNTTVDGQDDIDDNGDDWVWASGINTMTPGVGYAATHSQEAFIVPPGPFSPLMFKYSFNGAFNNGIITVPVYRNDSELNDINWNFIGNPYPSAIAIDDFLAANTVLDGAVYFWSQNTAPSSTLNGNEQVNFDNSDYAIVNAIGETAGGDGIKPSRFVPSGQGFFVSYSNAAIPENTTGDISEGTVNFNNAVRVTTNNDEFFRISNKTKSQNLNKVWLDLTSDNGVYNQILVAYAPGASNGYDGMAFDTPKNLATGNSALLYSLIEEDTKKYAIQGKDVNAIGQDEVIKIGFKTTIDVPTIYTLSIPAFEGSYITDNPIIVRDNLLNTSHNLKEDNYHFSSEVGEFNDRFEIIFNSEALANDEIDITNNSLTLIEHKNGDVEFNLDSIHQIRNIKIFDLQGRLLYNFQVSTNSVRTELLGLSQMPYIAQITLDNHQTLTKKAIKRY